MIALDHLILRVRHAAPSIDFYGRVLGLRHEGRRGPFEALRVNAGLVIDLLEDEVRERLHLAFRLGRKEFDAAHRYLSEAGIPFGGGPFEHDGAIGRTLGALGTADALYFHDPDGHNIEIRRG
jgi:catechol 2,3-dioxygenase-like lactoylglutathione lyase family enzyme